MNFAILVIIKKFLKTILIILINKLYIHYFNFEIFILNGLQKIRNRAKILKITPKFFFLVL